MMIRGQCELWHHKILKRILYAKPLDKVVLIMINFFLFFHPSWPLKENILPLHLMTAVNLGILAVFGSTPNQNHYE